MRDVDGVSGGAYGAVGIAGGDGDSLDGFGRADGDGRGIFGGGSSGGSAVGGVVDGGTGGGVADGYTLRGGVGTGRWREGGSCCGRGCTAAGCIGPRKNFLDGGFATGAAGESDIGGGTADERRNIDGGGSGEGSSGGGVGDSPGEGGAVVSHRDIHDVATVEIDAGTGHIDSRDGGHGAIGVHTGRVISLAGVVIEIELDGHTLRK